MSETVSSATPYGEFHAIPSAAAGGEIPVLTVVPPRPRATVYLLHGVNDLPRTEAGLRSAIQPSSGLRELAETHQVAVVAPLVPNRFYLDPPDGLPGARWGTAIGVELVDGIESRLAQLPRARAARFLCGFSMGGYGAISLLCRYPERFRAAASRCGLMDLATGVTDLAWDDAAWLVPILGSYFEHPGRYHLNSCPNLLNRIKDRPPEQAAGIVLEVGIEDFLLACNRRLREHLLRLRIPHLYTETTDGHTIDAVANARLFAGLARWLPA
jgi:putative tributyrin esterase